MITPKKISLAFVFWLVYLSAFSQLVTPVKWNYSQKQISSTEVDLILSAEILHEWHLYGMYFEEGGPNPTTVTFNKSDSYSLIGKVKQVPKPKEKMDEVFQIKIQEFSGRASFVQRIQIKSKTDFQVQVVVEGQACMEDGQCVLTDGEHTFTIKGLGGATTTDPPKQGNTEPTTTNETKPDTADKQTTTAVEKASTTDNQTGTTKTLLLDVDFNKEYLEKAAQENQTSGSLWFIFWGAFIAGLAALLTPCVFPMIPMTVTFFMKGSDNKAKARFHASVYGLSIIGIYTIIGTIVAVTLGPEFANWLSTHWLPNVFFFLIFMFFAASFLGMFEIMLPSWLINKVDSKADQGGLTGTFFMAFTLVLVSFSCTGPIVGSILVESAQGEFLKPVIGMFGFSLAFALPFTMFAFFPNWLKGLPKSGGWLNSVKVILGFLELALGLKFLSVADQTYHWGILDREVYIALWIVIFFLMGMYLIGKLKFSHDSDLPFVSVPRLTMGVLTFAFVVYLIPGMVGAPLKALSGYLPPQSSHDFDLAALVRNNAGNATDEASICEKPKYSEKLHLPHGLKGYFDYKQGLACAKAQNKPIFIDFTGHGCVNCREMEANVWSDPRVLQRLKKDYVVIAIYVDDKTDLPENEWVKSVFDGKMKRTLGKINADFQITNFNVNAQPFYVLLDHNGRMLNTPKAYDKDVDNFIDFLDKGAAEFKKRAE